MMCDGNLRAPDRGAESELFVGPSRMIIMRRGEAKIPLEALFLAKRAGEDLSKLEPRYWIRFVRGRARLTQQQLAEKAKLRQADVSRIESGRADPRLSTLRRVAGALGFRFIVLAKTESAIAFQLRYGPASASSDLDGPKGPRRT